MARRSERELRLRREADDLIGRAVGWLRDAVTAEHEAARLRRALSEIALVTINDDRSSGVYNCAIAALREEASDGE